MYPSSFQNPSYPNNPWNSRNHGMRSSPTNSSTRGAEAISPIPLATSMLSGSSSGLLPALKSFSWGGLLTGAQKTITAVNQLVPLYHQVQPLISNAKTLFKVSKVMKDIDSPSSASPKDSPTPVPNDRPIQKHSEQEEVVPQDENTPGKPFFI